MAKKIIVIGLLVLITKHAWGFGSATILGMQNEHARITTAALSCESTYDPLTKPVPCFDSKTMSNLGGEAKGAFPAVESPDNLALHFSGGPDWWHCDKADYISSPSYPQTRAEASKKLSQCRDWAQKLLNEGFESTNDLCAKSGAKSYLCTGVAARSRLMLDTKSRVDVEQPNYFTAVSGCSYNGNSGRIKCEILQQFGYALHVLQDFYSHSNYSDYNGTTPLSWNNPPGLFNNSLPSYWDLTQGKAPSIPSNDLSTGCYPSEDCFTETRSTHDNFNKDKATIDPKTGIVKDVRTMRASIVYAGQSNGQRAVALAIAQTRAAWNDLQRLIIEREGKSRGDKIICAIASDNPNSCGLALSQANGLYSDAHSMPQGEIPDKTKAQPFEWAMREYESQEADQKSPVILKLRSNSAKSSGGIIGINSSNPIECGDKTIITKSGIPDDNRKLSAYDLFVSGISCAQSVRELRRYYLFNTGNAPKSDASDLQCLVMSEQDAVRPEPQARIVCKNSDESIEMSFHPDCDGGSESGDCGL